MLCILIIACCVTLHAICIVKSDDLTRIFLLILFFSHLYFCVGGYGYWVYLQEGAFAGMSWDISSLERALSVLSLATVAVALIVSVANRHSRTSYSDGPAMVWSPKLLIWYLVLVLLGLVGCIVVLATGINSNFEERNDFLLIAYQFSDIVIPCILFSAAAGGRGKYFAGSIGIFFFFYAVMVGFRYKLALLFAPILFWQLFGTSQSRLRKIVATIIFGVGGLIVFSAMTLFRVKFGVPDFSRQIAPGDTLYSFFAESNIVFGMAAIMSRFVDSGTFYYLDPILDAVKGLIPHVIYLGRESGLYLREMQLGFLTNEGMNSKTAYPFVGEFAIMGGYVGILVGAIVYALVYVYFHNLVLRTAPNKSLRIMGIALLASIMGYYHYSRGYFPQAFKSYLFVFAPYLLFCSQAFRGKLLAARRTTGKITYRARLHPRGHPAR
jgi:hypothetical protein